MKKIKALFLGLGIGVLSFGIAYGGAKSNAPMFAYAESEQVEENTESTEPEETSEEQEPIDVDEETNSLSQTAKDTIEVIKEFFAQPLVIGGVSTTLGTVVLYVIAKLFGHALHKRDTKYDKKIAELLGKIGVNDDFISQLQAEYDKLREAIEEIINNTKNVKVKAKLEKILEDTKESADKVVDETINSGKVINENIAAVTETAKTDSEEQIKKILEGN